MCTQFRITGCRYAFLSIFFQDRIGKIENMLMGVTFLLIVWNWNIFPFFLTPNLLLLKNFENTNKLLQQIVFWVIILRVMHRPLTAAQAWPLMRVILILAGFNFLSSSSPRVLVWVKTNAMAVVNCRNDCVAFLLSCLVSAVFKEQDDPAH